MPRYPALFPLVLASFCFLDGVSLAAPAPDRPATAADQQPADPAKTRKKLFDDLFQQLREAPNPASASQTRMLIERVWARSGSPTADLLMSRAETALKAAQEQVAGALLDKIVGLYPDWSQAWRRRAQAAFAQGDSEGAMLDLNRALSAEPRDFLAMEQLAELFRETHRDGEALGLMRRALALDPHDEHLGKDAEDLAREIEGRPI
jgi:tetratricopeptide (TPR) repeat protein